MDHFDDDAERELARAFDQFRTRAQALVAPPGAAAAREAAARRRTTHALAGVALLASLVAGGTGYLIGTSTRPAVPAGPVTSASGAWSPTPSGQTGQSPAPSATTAVPAQQDRTGGTGTVQPPRCHTADLVAHVAQPAGGDRPGRVVLILTNESGHPCRMYGYPGLEVVDDSGGTVATEVVWDRAQPPAAFAVPDGGTAWIEVSWIAGTAPTATPEPAPSASGSPAPTTGPSAAPCGPRAGGLRIIPPNETTQLSIAVRLDLCPDATVTVGPVRPDPPG